MGKSLPVRSAWVSWCWEGFEDGVIEEVREGTVADVVQKARDAEGLHDEALARHRRPVGSESRSERWIEVSCPEARLMHHPEAVCEAAVFGGGEDPSGTLQLTDTTEALEPWAIEQILFGGLLWGVARGGCPISREALGQFDVAVDRVTDQVDRLELLRIHDYAFDFAVLP